MRELEPSYENIIKQELQIDDLQRAYHTLMGTAVRFAERLDMYSNSTILNFMDVRAFLTSPEVRAWREREEGTK